MWDIKTNLLNYFDKENAWNWLADRFFAVWWNPTNNFLSIICAILTTYLANFQPQKKPTTKETFKKSSL